VVESGSNGASDLETAEELGRRVALAAQRWMRGQEIARARRSGVSAEYVEPR